MNEGCEGECLDREFLEQSVLTESSKQLVG